MGTRHLIAVMVDGEYKVAQYGQWDGYPEGQGTDALAILRDLDMTAFAEKCRAAQFFPKEAEVYIAEHPQCSRDHGAKILGIIAKAPPGIRLCNSIGFAADSLFCEYAYVVDLDKRTFEVFKGSNKTPLAKTERFADVARPDDASKEYEPVRFVASFDLDNLPTEEAFLEATKTPDEDES